MSTILEQTQIVYQNNERVFKKISSILKDHFNLSHFYHYKLTNQGQLSLLHSDPRMIDYFQSTSFFLDSPPMTVHPTYRECGVKLTCTKQLRATQAKNVSSSFSLFNLNLWLKFSSKVDNGIEEFGFFSPQSDQKECELLLNRLSQLQFFMKWFLEEHRSIVTLLEENSTNLTSLIGPSFFKNKNQNIDLQDMERQKFFKRLGIPTPPKLSAGETEVLQLILNGYSALKIAEKLDWSKRCIEHRIERIKSKFDCYSKQELIQKAQELGHLMQPKLHH